jgi:type IV pilus assembly protein PilB
MVEMGLEPYLVSSSVDCIVAQRLARRLCERCREPFAPSTAELEALGWDGLSADDLVQPLYRAVGCGLCAKTGFLGRFALHEVLLVSEEIERLIAEKASSSDIKKVAVAQGMLTLHQAGVAQIRNGLTTIDEVLRVVA